MYMDLYVFLISLYFCCTCFVCYYTHPQEHKLQSTALGVCNGCGMLFHWSRYWLGHPLTFSTVKSELDHANIPQPLHTPKAVLCSVCS
jgi:hypothetical protein